MREYTVKGRKHVVYDLEEVPSGIEYLEDWRNGRVGDWVKADDECVIQILRRSSIGNIKTVGTCTGTFKIKKTEKMDTIRRENIYDIGGRTWYTRVKEREEPTPKEIIFAQRYALGEDPVKAYMKTYNSTEDRAKKMSALLIKQERIKKVVREELKDVFSKRGIDLDFLIGAAQDVVSGGKNDSDRLNALKMLWSAFGVVEEQKVTQVTGIFQGHSTAQLESARRPELGEGDG
tara:strand:- start:1571 stop:2269 length:699 start_codon:yes stop_codon:yes gene_type:complete